MRNGSESLRRYVEQRAAEQQKKGAKPRPFCSRMPFGFPTRRYQALSVLRMNYPLGESRYLWYGSPCCATASLKAKLWGMPYSSAEAIRFVLRLHLI